MRILIQETCSMTCMHTSRRSFLTSAATFAALGLPDSTNPDSTNPDSTNACGDDRHATARAGSDGEDALQDVAALWDKVIREATIQVH
jgi:hypothetical protein